MANEIVKRLEAYGTENETAAIEVAAGLLVFYGPIPDQEFVTWLADALPAVREHLRTRFALTDAQVEARTRRLHQRIEFYRCETARRALISSAALVTWNPACLELP